MTKTITSFTSNTKYFLTIDPQLGRATSCTCPDCQWRHRQCKHIKDFDAQVTRQVKFNQMMAQYDVRSQAQRDARASLRFNVELAMGW